MAWNLSDCEFVLLGVAAILNVMPHSEITVLLRELCFMQLTPLVQLIDQDVVPIKGTTSDPVLWLDRLSSVMRHVSITGVRDGKYILFSQITGQQITFFR